MEGRWFEYRFHARTAGQLGLVHVKYVTGHMCAPVGVTGKFGEGVACGPWTLTLSCCPCHLTLVRNYEVCPEKAHALLKTEKLI